VDWAAGPSGIAAFTQNLTALGGAVQLTSAAQVAMAVAGIIAGRSPLLLGSEPIVQQLRLDGIRWPDCTIADAAGAEVAVVGCRAAVARTGSVVVDARLAHGR